MIKHTSSKHLQELKQILLQIGIVEYSKKLPILEDGTIGKHVRHILEFYECLLLSPDAATVCYDDRKRNLVLEQDLAFACAYIDTIIEKTEQISSDRAMTLVSRYGEVEVAVQSSLFRELTYNIEHTVHHLAIIRIAVLSEFKDISVSHTFGYADSTVQFQRSQKAI